MDMSLLKHLRFLVYIHVQLYLSVSVDLRKQFWDHLEVLRSDKSFIVWNMYTYIVYLSNGHQSLQVNSMQKFPCVHRMWPCVNAVFVVVLFAELSQMAVQCI